MTAPRTVTDLTVTDRTVALGLGSNLGNRLQNLRSALSLLRRSLEITKTSDVFETAPWGPADQPCFLNACLLAVSALGPEELLALLKDVEAEMGRVETRRWGERVIDIDILAMGELTYESDTLRVPHVDMHRRVFVLTPLAQILPDWVHPRIGRTVSEMESLCKTEREKTVRICPL